VRVPDHGIARRRVVSTAVCLGALVASTLATAPPSAGGAEARARSAADVVWPASVLVSAPGEQVVAPLPQVAAGSGGDTHVLCDTSQVVRSASRAAAGGFAPPQTAVSAVSPPRTLAEMRTVAGPAGSVVALWQRGVGDFLRIQTATRSAAGEWGDPETLSADGAPAFNARLAAGPDGSVHAIWVRGTGSADRVQVATRSPEGTWSAPEDVSGDLVAARRPQVAVGPDGTVAAVWGSFDGAHERVQGAARAPGGAWSTPVTLSDAGDDAFEPAVAVGPDGAVTAVWGRGSSETRIETARLVPGGEWSAPEPVSAPGASGFGPTISIAPTGERTVVWSSDVTDDGRIEAASAPPGGGFAAPVPVSDPDDRGQTVVTAIGPDGSVVAVWFNGSGANAVRAAIRPAAGAWGEPQLLSSPGVDAASATVAIGADGTVVVGWEDSPPGEESEVRAVVVDHAFAPVVPPPARVKPRLRLGVKPKRDRAAPYAYRLAGRLTGDFAASPDACSGRVTLQVKQGRRTLVRKQARVRPTCRYQARVKVAEKKLRGRGQVRLTVVASYGGNAVLLRARTTARLTAR
jgi:hypothetical protein